MKDSGIVQEQHSINKNMEGVELKIKGQTIHALMEKGVLTWINRFPMNELPFMRLNGLNGIETWTWYDNQSEMVDSYEINIVEIVDVSSPLSIKTKETQKLLEEYRIMETELKELGMI